MKHLNSVLFLLCVFGFLLSATDSIAQRTTQVETLNLISKTRSIDFKQKKATAVAYAKQEGIPTVIEMEGRVAEIMELDPFGKPQYYITDNNNAASSIATKKLYPAAGFGFSLTGLNTTIHEWDAGAVLGTHQEFSGRVNQVDGATSVHYHSTHVAGTMIASGVVANAKGMSPAANLRAFDWNNDESEMASEGALNALISNHSYGYVRGWLYTGGAWNWYGTPSISTTEDYLFGFYDSQAWNWDQIARNAPYFLICKSAGNDRNEGPTGGAYPKDGPYDCISHAGISKNVMTIGAVNDIANGYTQASDVVMSTFSCWGPADDGRIKPDLVSNGVSLYSTYSTNSTSYASMSGTSMAAPSAAGSLLLLQEHYKTLKGNYMLASTLKALAIHTADEAGTASGPDYQFGWGLINAYKAAQKISEDQTSNVIDELVLNSGNTYQRQLTSTGLTPLKVTIVWTDPAGTIPAASLDPLTPALINDLDIRLVKDNITYYPWKLDPLNPGNPATRTSENNVDNVEYVMIDMPIPGDYTLIVDHDGFLSGGSQAFSVIISGISNLIPLPPVASFSASATTITAGQSITFSDISTQNPVSRSWVFEGGNPGSSTLQNPSVAYTSPGTYDVRLIATNAQGTDTLLSTNFITVNNIAPLAQFTANSTMISAGDSVQFTDGSMNSPASWSWTFPGGSPSISNVQHPLVHYNQQGIYPVSLKVTNSGGTDSLVMTNYVVVDHPAYCAAASQSFAHEYISLFRMGVSLNYSLGSTYSDFTDQMITLTAGAYTNFSIGVTFPGGDNTTVYFGIYIDYNNDGDFTDQGEAAFLGRKPNNLSSAFIVPTTASGTTMARVIMRRGGPTMPCGLFSFGEVEDYTVSFLPPTNANSYGTSNPFVHVYPNPATDYMQVDLSGLETCELTIKDSKGAIHQQIRLTNQSEKIDLTGLSPGIYLLHFLTDKQVFVEKLIKRK